MSTPRLPRLTHLQFLVLGLLREGEVLGNGAKIAAVGTGIGLIASFVAGRALQSLLFSTAPSDPAVLAGAAGLLGVTAMLACYLPARRASRVDPVATLNAR